MAGNGGQLGVGGTQYGLLHEFREAALPERPLEVSLAPLGKIIARPRGLRQFVGPMFGLYLGSKFLRIFSVFFVKMASYLLLVLILGVAISVAKRRFANYRQTSVS
jgi:hypothetical protein